MRAWRLDDSAKLLMEEIPGPKPRTGEVLIRVHAAGVTPTEVLWYPTTKTKTGEERKNAIPGHEFFGTIASVGERTSEFVVGQEIYGMNDWFADGATAEYCITKPEWIAAKPKKLTHKEAATVPIGALTAWQGLFDRARLQAGESVLIHGGSGAVGVFAVQLARLCGAQVVTTASARNREFLLQLGAERVIDYHSERFEEKVKGIDVVFDTVGGETLRRSWEVLGSQGRLVTVAASSESPPDEKTKNAFFIVEPKAAQLSKIGELLENDDLKVALDAAVPFERADTAYMGEIKERRGRGKVVVTVVK